VFSIRFGIALLGMLLVSCGATRHGILVDAEELPRFVLVVQDAPDGQGVHSWRPAEEFELSRYRARAGAAGASGRIVLAAAWRRDCHAEYVECVEGCLDAPLPRHLRHVPRRSSRHESICNDECLPAYLDCSRLQEILTQEFTAIDVAVDWVKRNRRALLLGSIVVIAGTAFVVVSAGAGLLVLAPAVLVASAVTPAESGLAAVSP
jgi:hypothetical protein